MWDGIPGDNKSKFIRDVLRSYFDAGLEYPGEIQQLQERNQMLQYVVRHHEQTIEDLRNDKEVLQERLPPPRGSSIWEKLKFWK